MSQALPLANPQAALSQGGYREMLKFSISLHTGITVWGSSCLLLLVAALGSDTRFLAGQGLLSLNQSNLKQKK
ncbi:MAG TPA: hypothetical protein DCY88_28825 [Cyanobacteria bacterium UBA11372]|nr:hypothetical protein [Cyanobacteria bacterium UBA11372]